MFNFKFNPNDLIEEFEDWGKIFRSEFPKKKVVNPVAERVAPKSEQKSSTCEKIDLKDGFISPFNLKVNGKDMSWISDYFSNIFKAKTGKEVKEIGLSEWADYDSIVMDCVKEIVDRVSDMLDDDEEECVTKIEEVDEAPRHKCGDGCGCDHTCSTNTIYTNGAIQAEETPKSVKLISNDDGNISFTFSSNDSEKIKQFMDKITESHDFDNFSIVMPDGSLCPVKVEEIKTFEEPKPDYTMDQLQKASMKLMDTEETLNDFSRKSFKEALKDAYFIEFRNGDWASLQSYGSDDKPIFYDNENCYVFYEEDFDEEGKCILWVNNASDWDIVAVYGNTVSPYHPLSLVKAPCIWEVEPEDFMHI